MECENCSGTADFTLYEVHYAEGEGDSNRMPNWKFANGLEGWDAWGAGGTWELVASDQGSGSALHVTAQPGQTAAINSTNFAVTAGAGFTATFIARVAPASEGSGSGFRRAHRPSHWERWSPVGAARSNSRCRIRWPGLRYPQPGMAEMIATGPHMLR